MGLSVFNLRFGLPVKTFRILEKFSPYIPDPRTGFLNQVPFAVGRKVAINTVDMDSTLIVIMCG
jgi:hypothetical protein